MCLTLPAQMSVALAEDAVRRLLLPGRLCMAALRGSAAAWMGMAGWLGTMSQMGECMRIAERGLHILATARGAVLVRPCARRGRICNPCRLPPPPLRSHPEPGVTRHEVAELSRLLALCSGVAVFGSGGGTLLWHSGDWRPETGAAGAEVRGGKRHT
jgi:hypothetical protein